jgi:hypothetical protein
MIVQAALLLASLYFLRKGMRNTSSQPYPDDFYNPSAAMPGIVDDTKNLTSTHFMTVDENYRFVDGAIDLKKMKNYTTKYMGLVNNHINCHTNEYIDPKFEGASKVYPRNIITDLN